MPPLATSAFKQAFSGENTLFLLGFIVRLLLIAYSTFHDSHFDLKYTDIDYDVFTNAASLIYNNETPYYIESYRYTPLIAFLLVPNVIYFKEFGKVLFSCFDILTAYIAKKTLKLLNTPEQTTNRLICVYLFNPITLAISTRGNADALLTFFVISSIYFIIQHRLFYSSLCLAVAIHLKLYPIIYIIPFWVTLYNFPVVENFLLNIKYNTSPRVFLKALFRLLKDCIINLNLRHLKFFGFTAFSFLCLTVYFFESYGFDFLYQTYIYHFIRMDHRHNLSLYFYYIYHLVDKNRKMSLLVQPLFQAACVLACGVFVKDLVLAMCLQTIVFVALNKVCTCQYFIWWLCLLPLALSKVDFNKYVLRRLARATLFFFVTLGNWLLFAYLLEFKGFSTYKFMLLSSVFFTLAQFNIAWEVFNIHSNRLEYKNE